jgi:ribonucleoside-diphosphate reductase alpha chain
VGNTTTVVDAVSVPAGQPVRRRLPDERKAIVHHFNVGGYEGYLTVGFYEDGTVGEIFITTAKEGSTVSGLMDCFATTMSLALQYRVPLKVLCDKFSHTRFEPSGWSGNPEIGYAKSLTDYVARYLALKFLPRTSPSPTGAEAETPATAPAHLSGDELGDGQADAPACKECGAITVIPNPSWPSTILELDSTKDPKSCLSQHK